MTESNTQHAYGVYFANIDNGQTPVPGMRIFSVLQVCLFRPFSRTIRIATYGSDDLLTLLAGWNTQGHWYYASPAPADNVNLMRVSD